MNPMKVWIYNLSREQFDYFRNGGGVRIRRHARRKNFGDVGTSVLVKFEGNMHSATIANVYVEGAWMYAHLVPRKASQ